MSTETIFRLETRKERNLSLLALQALADYYYVECLDELTEDQWPRDHETDWPRNPERFPWYRDRRRGVRSLNLARGPPDPRLWDP